MHTVLASPCRHAIVADPLGDTTEPIPHPTRTQTEIGLAYGLGAYICWGFIPLYFRLVRHVPPVDVVAHRVTWSVLFLAIVLTITGGWREVSRILRSLRILLALMASAIFIAINWLVYVWAIEHDQVMQGSLGYFITPLVSVLLGVAFLGERLRRLQILCILLAMAGVVYLTFAFGRVPWIALTLAVSFSLYGFVRKKAPVGPLVGLLVETAMLLPFAGMWIIMSPSATHLDAKTCAFLALAGPVTSIPLVLFAAGARRLRLTTMGVLQYLSPTCQFLLAVLVFGEPFTPAQRVSFVMIWVALAIYTADSIRAYRKLNVPPLEVTDNP